MPGCSLVWGSACSSAGSNADSDLTMATTENLLDSKASLFTSNNDIGFCNGHGECFVDSMDQQIAKCECEPGWEGERCERSIDWVEFTSRDAFLKYFLQVEPPYQDSRLRLLFLPGFTGNGQLASAFSQSGPAAYMKLELIK